MCPPHHPSKQENIISLKEAETGGTFRIASLAGANCQRLREIGFCESVEVQKLSGGRVLVCSVCGTRLAVSRDLAAQVMVKPIPLEDILPHGGSTDPATDPKG